MLRPLSNMRRRVEQLGCGESHQRHRWVIVSGDDPMPAWPERDQGERCRCGAELVYVTIVDVIHTEPHPARVPRKLTPTYEGEHL